MKFTLAWLKDHLETEASFKEITDTLSMIGLEVEGIEDRAEALKAFTVARVKEARQHPNADRLRVCIVDTGREEVQVVCGAPNAKTGMLGVFAPVGSYVPGTEITLKAGNIRGEESNGMLVSEREMGLSDDHEGIIELSEDVPLGTPFARVAGLDDPVIEIAITPNRGDCLGVRGIARDLAAAGLGTLKPLDETPVPGVFESPIKWRRDLPEDQQHLCPFVAGRSFRNVKNGPSPKWMQDRLRAIGLRPISALVDITNYVTFGLNRPLHVFDADKVKGDVVMRLAKPGSEIVALDGDTYSLDETMVVIEDDAGPEGIGGIMGGEVSGCTEETTNVFLEAALFDPVRVAESGRKLGIHSDARYRFERGVDPNFVLPAVEVASRLILELCGGEASAVVTAGELPAWDRQVSLRPSRTATLCGVEIAADRQGEILERLGFAVGQDGDRLTAAVPSWRPDIEGEACLVEEVLRIHGYDAIPEVDLPRETYLPKAALSPSQRRVAATRTALAWRGMLEGVTFSFVSSKEAALFGGMPDALRLDNPISADLDVMRPTPLANLASAAVRNADRGYGDLALFEVGPQYHDDSPKGQATVAAGIRAGESQGRNWTAAPRPVDAFDAKGDAEAVLAACAAPTGNLQVTPDAPAWYHPGRSGVLRLGPNVLAQFGELHPRVLKALDLKGPAVAFEVFLDRVPLPRAGKQKPALLTLSAFQPVSRDFAFLVDEDVPAEKLLRAARGADKALISDVALFDVYRGKGVEPGKKSLAIAVTLQPREATLTDQEIEAVAEKVVKQVTTATGGALRA
ncbi:phenylalanine--tRNA ligase subunit beta [Pelagibius litoralis]|uniref:Phenylalanine--tRNA ligase beta subunit n=1 Tax=Pelagibius litoralis TaxID=374515 RepID=A0A967C7C8_9PROT|nr:phenylalanine--tRNA ligase subunit beta [Pelagibius litoralis]NIA67932.1 phenylalanine--tRNA ligase subunit beta [Pelagibius litoralis]